MTQDSSTFAFRIFTVTSAWLVVGIGLGLAISMVLSSAHAEGATFASSAVAQGDRCEFGLSSSWKEGKLKVTSITFTDTSRGKYEVSALNLFDLDRNPLFQFLSGNKDSDRKSIEALIKSNLSSTCPNLREAAEQAYSKAFGCGLEKTLTLSFDPKKWTGDLDEPKDFDVISQSLIYKCSISTSGVQEPSASTAYELTKVVVEKPNQQDGNTRPINLEFTEANSDAQVKILCHSNLAQPLNTVNQVVAIFEDSQLAQKGALNLRCTP
jgi:hypothetical protein